jgi:Na+/phosphate symporter
VVVKLDKEKLQRIRDIKVKMLKVKETTKKCRKLIKKKEKLNPQDDLDKFSEFVDSCLKLAKSCIKQLKDPELGSHISNQKQLVDKLRKYSEILK